MTEASFQRKTCILDYKRRHFVLIGYSDADFAGDLDDQRSTSGNLFLMSGGSALEKAEVRGFTEFRQQCQQTYQNFMLLSLVSEQRIVFVCLLQLCHSWHRTNLPNPLGIATQTHRFHYTSFLCTGLGVSDEHTQQEDAGWTVGERKRCIKAATQIMNINNITRMYAKITGGGGIPPLAASP